MLRQSKPTTLLSALWLLVASSAPRAAAVPYPKDELYLAGYGYLEPRNCDGTPCGSTGQYCCSGGSQCVTANGVALCTAAGGAFNLYTSTWTVTYTSTWSSWIPAATGINGADCIPTEGSGHIACGVLCCDSWQYCAQKVPTPQCMANGPGPGGGGVVIGTTVTTAIQTRTTQFSAPFRVTSGTATVTTGTAAQATQTDDGGGAGQVTEGTGGGLSGGAIAGIVIGTLAGIALLLLICACCVVRGLWHGVMAIVGLGGKKKKKSETIIEEEHYRRGSSNTRRDNHSSWYGGRPSTVTSRKEKKSGAGLLGIGAALGTLALLLGLRKDKKKAPVKSRSDISSSYYSDVYTDQSPSSMSSDRRTRRSHRSHRHSRTASRVTRTTTRVSRAPSARSARGPSRSPRRSPPR